MSEELNYDVKPVKVTNSAGWNMVDPEWPTDDRVYGYYPGIFGPGWYGDDGYSLQCPAFDHLDTRLRDPLDSLFETPEEAMKAWTESGAVTMSALHGSRYYLRQNNVDAINAQGVFRHYDPDFADSGEVPF